MGLYTEQFDVQTVRGHHRDEVMCIVSSVWGLICRMERNGTEWNGMERNCSLNRGTVLAETVKVAQDRDKVVGKALWLCLLLPDD